MIVSPLCVSCRHCHLPQSATCTAYPDGIPDGILQQGFDHSRPYPGDNGIRFEPKPNVKLYQEEAPPLQKAS